MVSVPFVVQDENLNHLFLNVQPQKDLGARFLSSWAMEVFLENWEKGCIWCCEQTKWGEKKT